MISVLIVDDDKLARKGLISIMPWSSHGMVVVGEAANGAKALEFLEENPVDLMFVDISMPVISGIELIQECKKLYPDMQFVVLTFHEDFEYVQTAFRLGVLDYISKVRLEIEDNDEIFDRIQQKLKVSLDKSAKVLPEVQFLGTKNTENLSSTQYEGKWPKLQEDWCGLYWLYDEDAFRRLCTQTEELNPPVRRLQDLFLRVILQVKGTTHIDVESNIEIVNLKSAIECIRQYRDALYKRVAQMTDSAETSICILKAVIFIHDKIGSPLHAEMVADYVNMSRGYFSLCFKKLVGHTFNSYLRKERVRIATQLLLQSNQSISLIAKTVGYGDVKYFSHIFQEEMNMLPSEFRLKFCRGDK